MIETNPRVDEYLRTAPKWREELQELRDLLLDCELTEEFKWGKPCYTFQGSNVVLIVPFKQCCALLFTMGALLKDDAGVLIQPTENTQAARQMRFTRVQEIVEQKLLVKSYVRDAIEVEKSGLQVEFKKSTEFALTEEFQNKLDENPALKTAFVGLTPGRQKAYHLHFSAPKQSKTRESRIEKCLPHILAGKGLNDQ